MKHGPGVDIAIALVVLAWILVRQVQARPVTLRAMLVLPLALAVIGIVQITHVTTHNGDLTSSQITWIAIDVGAAIVTGAIRAPTVRLFERAGELWRQGTRITVALWIVSIAIRVIIDLIGKRHGAGTALDHSLLLSFGVSLAAQYAVIAWRGHQTGIPFAGVAAGHST